MVRALHEIHRALVDEGILIDLRPVSDRCPVDIASARGCVEAGRLTELPKALADDSAANNAMEQVNAEGIFSMEQTETFPVFYTWDTPNDFREYIADEWSNFLQLGEETFNRVRSIWASADGDARVRLRMKMLIARWRKR